MFVNSIISTAAVAVTFATVASAAACPACKEVTVDVAILGGGAAGSYVAGELTDVHGKNVIVVDHNSRLGGHVDTVDVPGLGPVDFGVLSYHNLSFVQGFFNRYGVNIVAPAAGAGFKTTYLDQRTAEPVNVTQYSADEQNAAIQRWTDFGLKYKNYTYPSYNLPNPLGDAAVLARPFIETVRELQLESIVVMLLDAHWSNDLLALPTLQAMSTFGFAWFDGTPMVVPESHNNTQLYANIQAHLGDKVLLNTRVTAVHRDGDVSMVTVRGPTGCTLIKAKQIVVGFVPTESNMAPFDTDPEEKDLFSKFSCVNLHNGLVNIPGYPQEGIDLNPVSSDPDRLFIPTNPNVRFIGFAGTPYQSAYVVGNPDTDEAGAKKLLEDRLATITGVGPYTLGSKPEYLGFSDHSPLVCSVSQEEMEAGFWAKIRALQGQKGTFYVGQAVAADLTAYVWAQAQEVIDIIVSGA